MTSSSPGFPRHSRNRPSVDPATPISRTGRLVPSLAAAAIVLALFALVGFGLPVESAPEPPGKTVGPSGAASPPLHGETERELSSASRSWTYPEARRSKSADILHGREITDPYRWMEDMDSAETHRWARAQDELARETLHGLPGFEALQERMQELNRFDSLGAPVPRGERLFFTRRAPGQRTSVLYVQDGLRGEPRVLVDANRFEGQTLRGFVPSPDGRRVAYALAPTGTSWGVWRIRDLGTGKDLPDELVGVRYGAPMWSPDGRELFYSAFEVPEGDAKLEAALGIPSVYRHRVGHTGPDPVLFERPDQPLWVYGLNVTEDGRWLVLRAAEGTASEVRVFLLDLKAEDPKAPDAVRALVPEAVASYGFLGDRQGRLFFQTDREAPRSRVVAVDLTVTETPDGERELEAEWSEIVPQSEEVLSLANVVADCVIGFYLKDALPEVRIFDLGGGLRHTVHLPQSGTTFSGFQGRRTDAAAYFTVNSVALPSTPYRLDPKSGELTLMTRPNAAFDPQSFELGQVFYKGKDGTRIPMFLAHKKGLDPRSDRPVMMYGYGAYGWSAFPWYQPQIVAWMEHGGVYALPGIRGGGEYGERWHKAGSGRHKQTSIDDFVAAAELLIERGYTSREKLAVRGGSASGMLAGAALAQRPELFSAVLINIPVLDLIRGHKLTGGAYRFAEFGTPESPEDLEALLGYSPYHNLRSGTCYPATLLVAGENDETAPPVHAYKFAAELQHILGNAEEDGEPCPEPALLKVAWGAGHSVGATPEDYPEAWASEIAFLAWQTGLEIHGPGGDRPDVAEPEGVGER